MSSTWPKKSNWLNTFAWYPDFLVYAIISISIWIVATYKNDFAFIAFAALNVIFFFAALTSRLQTVIAIMTINLVALLVFTSSSQHSYSNEESVDFVEICLECVFIVAFSLINRKKFKELEAEKAIKRQIINSSPDFISVKDLKGRYRLVNTAVAKALNKSDHEILGESPRDLVGSRPELDFLDSLDREVIESGQVRTSTLDSAVDGKRTVHLIVKAPLRSPTGELEGIITYSRDITEMSSMESKIEEQKIKSQTTARMAELGFVASSIVHEVNTPIAVIDANVSQIFNALESEIIDRPFIAGRLEKIANTTVRINKIVSGLKSYARSGEGDPFIRTRMSNLIEAAVDLCGKRCQGRRISLLVDPFDAELELECRGVQIVQIMVNLINNASDAVESLEKRWIRLSVEDQGENILLQVTDSGTGIPRDVADKMLTPFFSTKPAGKGTGLGLSIVSGIVAAHFGDISVDHECLNTRICIHLPKKHRSEQRKSA